MERRDVLGTTCSFVVAAVAGCLSDQDEIGMSDSVPTEISNWEATRDLAQDAVPASDESPRITVDGDSTVVVEGYVSYPSGNCDELVISPDRTEYDPEDGSLSVWVGYIRDQVPGEGCAVPESSTPYQVRVSFDDGLPDTVTAVEYGSHGEKEATKP
ncbi:hypothetical protein [Natronolimnobius baerhuensis]|uniref:Uncharacterized protein n=1 Tax=Natronolimnobius baerhuensis TaxID=253108 RepID=A0A202E777_9EURY|nr:hypothetical protein [Natronolimnobius baerhuensis]OVE84044.1 hypothetical protein B2G88_06290 [Natronolimnobius baerhuensis]